LGEYSILQNKWLKIPSKRRSNLDQTATKQKYEKLAKLAEFALHTKDLSKLKKVLETIKRYRQAGLDFGGEFGPENLAYKMLRSQGIITKLYDLRDKLHSQRLSIEGMYSVEEADEKMYKHTPTVEQLVIKYKVPKRDILIQLDKGIKVELEHTSDRNIARKIALDHMREDPHYYNKLAKVGLEESFDKPYEVLRWEKGDYGDVDAIARLDDGTFLSIMFNKGYSKDSKEEAWSVEFWRNNSQEVTGEGDQQRVFATVLSAIQTFIKKYEPNKITFAANKVDDTGHDSQSRANLYDKLVQRYAKSWGFKAFRADTGNKVIYELSRIKKDIAEESFDGIEISLEKENDEIMVTAMANGKELGQVLFVEENGYLLPQDLEVDERYRGQGIASTMYNYVKSQGYKIRRSGQQTDAGAGFWGKHRPEQNVWEARRNPEQNRRSGSGKYDLINYAEDNINDKDNWAVSMTMEPKLGINPRAAVSEDTPKGIYFYPLRYFMQMADRDESLPWGDNFPYLQLFQYNRSGEMTKQTKVDPAKLKQVLLQYCPEEVIQQASEEDEYDGTPYWFIYDCLSRLGQNDETNVVRWNKVLRDLGFTSVYDDGGGWIAYNEPTQGVVLDPRIIKQHKMFDNRNPTLQHRRYDIQGLADAIGWSSYFQRESQLEKIYNHPNEEKVRLAVAKSMLKPFLGKSSEEADEMGYDQAIKAAADKVIEILKQPINEASGYIPSEKQKNDPRFKTALTVDVHPDSIKKNAKAFGWLTTRAGIPPTAKPSGKI
jgi:GNAT superfamily N-acetyltransferase